MHYKGMQVMHYKGIIVFSLISIALQISISKADFVDFRDESCRNKFGDGFKCDIQSLYAKFQFLFIFHY